MYVGAGVTILLFILVITINYLQENYPEMLPYMLKDWKFLPKPLRTLETIDYVVQTYMEVVSLQGVPYHWAPLVFVIFSGSRAHREELFIVIG